MASKRIIGPTIALLLLVQSANAFVMMGPVTPHPSPSCSTTPSMSLPPPPTPSCSSTSTMTPTPTSTSTPSPSSTLTPTPTSTPTPTPTESPPCSSTPSPSATPSISAIIIITPEPSLEVIGTGFDPSPSCSPPAATVAVTVPPTVTPVPSPTCSSTPTYTPMLSPSCSTTPSSTPVMSPSCSSGATGATIAPQLPYPSVSFYPFESENGPSSIAPIPTVSSAAATVPGTTEAALFSPDPDMYYTLTAKYEETSTCLAGNAVIPGALLSGASFMDTCSSSTGQMWKFVPASNGFYRLKTKALEGANFCLEGNKLESAATLKGASFMEACMDHDAQLWKIQHRGTKFFTLTSKFRLPYGECLDGNQVPNPKVLDGAAYMSVCTVSDQQLFTAIVA